MVTVTFTWGRINPKTPSAWDSASAHYEKEVGKPFNSLSRAEQISYVRQYVNR
jgi:hypothetical protein